MKSHASYIYIYIYMDMGWNEICGALLVEAEYSIMTVYLYSIYIDIDVQYVMYHHSYHICVDVNHGDVTWLSSQNVGFRELFSLDVRRVSVILSLKFLAGGEAHQVMKIKDSLCQG